MKKLYSLLLFVPFLMSASVNADAVKVPAEGPAKVAKVVKEGKPKAHAHKHKHHAKHHMHKYHGFGMANGMNKCYRETRDPFCGPTVMVVEKMPSSFGCWFK